MTQADMLSINTVAAKLGLSVHQLRRWELMFGLEIKRGRGQQRQYRAEDLSVLERIKELVEQGWPTSQIRPQLEAEGLITPKLIGVPQQPGNPEMLMEAIIGLRSFAERRFIEISKQIDELRQLMISITLRNELRNEISSPWQPVEEEFAPPVVNLPPQEISIGPNVNVAMPENEFSPAQTHTAPQPSYPQQPSHPAFAPQTAPATAIYDQVDEELADEELTEEELADLAELAAETPLLPQTSPVSTAPAPTALNPAAVSASALPTAPAPVTTPAPLPKKLPSMGLGEVTDQNYLTILGKALDLIGWSDEQADQYSSSTFGVSHWDELGRSEAEKLIAFLVEKMGG
ncbi:MAG: MerR family transcriptional regulator [Candidatus Obscuribacterales bacterium]|nr:MerR family transcriptional regulator [Candidatus Obscuribacterales bacterium]